METLLYAFDLSLVVLAFGGIIAIHELGHFLAAKWAGIRVLTFAIGMGPALFSWRKGLGFRLGSSEREYQGLMGDVTVSPTEYRLNILPLGGYVKMLGQDDLDPSARSSASDSFQNCVPWKRMIVISAGVICNIVTAAIFFVIVFSIGLRDIAPVVGDALPGRPAATTLPSNGAEAGMLEPGLKPGDRILSIDGAAPETFADIGLASAMASRGSKLSLVVERPGVKMPLRFEMEPREEPSTRMLSLGFDPALSGQTYGTETRLRTQKQRDLVIKQMAAMGLPGVEPGMTLWRVGTRSAAANSAGLTPYDIDTAVRASGGAPVDIAFQDPAGREAPATIKPLPEYQAQAFSVAEGLPLAVQHLLGLLPVMSVRTVEAGSGGEKAGLKPGDVFARLGDSEWPSVAEGIAEIRRPHRTSIKLTVWRPGSGESEGTLVDLGDVPVNKGAIGFYHGSTADASTLIARWPTLAALDAKEKSAPAPISGAARPSGARLEIAPGSQIVSVNGQTVRTLGDVRIALQKILGNAPAGDVPVALEIRRKTEAGAFTERVAWTVPEGERGPVAKLSWLSPLPSDLWERQRVTSKASGPGDAIARGLSRTHKVMLNVYVTFARLFQGTVKVEHLQGPVGIAHAGTIFADRGYVWLLFFMALVSVNLAVVNFLPMPIVDGGLFLFLLYEQFTGRPVSVAFQNAATLVGLVLIGSMFLLVTYNDVVKLIWN